MSLVGEKAPDFELESTTGGTVRLSETLSSGPSVIVLFRGVWCSFCAEQLQTFSELAYDMHRHQGIDIVPVTNDPVSDLVAFRDRFDLRIQLCSDPDFSVAEAYTGVEEHPELGQYTRSGTFVVDPEGIVRYQHVAAHAADRTYANFVRYFVRNDYEDEFFERV
ncbi:MAG: peroxiredoxin family protein [Halodesulfurarchaeum sp.]